MALDMALVSAFVRATRRPVYADAGRFRAHLQTPKPVGAPPSRLHRRHRVTAGEIDGFRCVTVTPRHRTADADGPMVLYLHGGAYVSPIARQHWALISRLAGAGAAVHVPLYGRAPQHTYREAYRLLDTVYADLAPRADRLTVMGDSAGGGLALGLVQTLRDTGRPLPRALTLIAPWVDITCSNPRIAAIAPHDPWLSTVGAKIAGNAWAGDADPTDPRLSPVFGSMAGLPPIDLYYGDRDITFADADLIAAPARAAGVAVDLTVAPGSCHVYPLTPTRIGRRDRARIVARATAPAG